ncbi:FimV/HubP family polar landmark protein [Rheinheimera soli]|uniref:FimV-like protein n=1 Tax=Rheinheimera soli TaxID=443616 RepID=A0ABU1W4Q5_9GAMM|nr:FimV/HubP family polar landmark protein [Rheinheimera soli]MDR7122937.1 FimV-like protein [Rheinheimera soli]
MRLVGLLIFSILLQICSVNATADTTVRLKGPKSSENPDRSRVGPLTPNDTLWRIAEEVRPHPGLNIYQVMYSIYLKNPEAFLDDNFNHLNVGSFLAIPNVDEILTVDAVDAQRKSEEDDRIWADRVRAAAAAKVKQGVNTAQQKDVDKAKQEIKQELSRVEGQQKGQLLDLQSKLAESKVTVEAVLADNTALKQKLDQLADQMLLMKSQVDKDSEIQQQLQLLVAQQAEMLAQQKAQIEREQQGTSFAELWQNISSSSLTWVLLASLPTLFVLFAVLGWIKRRTKKSEQIVNAATAVPQQESGYRSPLPPLDESLDFDESSLMTLDESLLDTGSHGIRLDDEPIDLHDDMLLDTRADEFDDILMNDDDLLDSKDLFDASSMDDELLDDLLDQPAKAPEKDFDPNNILSGADLSSLFDEEPELDADEDVFAQAVAEQLAEEQKQKQNEQTNDEQDELIEEIELDELDGDTFEVSSPASAETDEFSLDEIEEVEEVDFDSLLDELVVTNEAPQVEQRSGTALEQPVDDTADVLDVTPEQPHFDSSELDEFAESLADEELSIPEPLSIENETDIDIDALLDGTANWPDSVKADKAVEPAHDEFHLTDEPDLVAGAEVHPETTLEFDEDDYPLSPDDVALLLSDEASPDPLTAIPAHFHADHGDLAELIQNFEAEADMSADDFAADITEDTTETAAQSSDAVADELLVTDLDDAPLGETAVADELQGNITEDATETAAQSSDAVADELLVTDLDDAPLGETDVADELQPELAVSDDDSAVLADELSDESEANETWQELSDLAAEPSFTESVPDLDSQEDLSVSRVSAATLSVENPSKVLEEYPDLEFSDEAGSVEETDDEFELEQNVQEAGESAVISHDTQQANNDIASELEALDETDFDTLLADYAQTDIEARLADEQVADAVLAELDLDKAETDSDPLSESETEAQQMAQSDDLAFSLLALDKLLDDSEDEPLQSQNPVRNIDVGLEDYQDFIAAQHEPELDPAEQGFAADLDLIRAYIEIGEQDGAEHLIDKVLSSTAPEHIKQEAQSLKDLL